MPFSRLPNSIELSLQETHWSTGEYTTGIIAAFGDVEVVFAEVLFPTFITSFFAIPTGLVR